jgi:hypothetical protein
MVVDLPGRAKAAVELAGDPGGSIRVSRQKHHRSVIPGFGPEVDLRHWSLLLVVGRAIVAVKPLVGERPPAPILGDGAAGHQKYRPAREGRVPIPFAIESSPRR